MMATLRNILVQHQQIIQEQTTGSWPQQIHALRIVNMNNINQRLTMSGDECNIDL